MAIKPSTLAGTGMLLLIGVHVGAHIYHGNFEFNWVEAGIILGMAILAYLLFGGDGSSLRNIVAAIPVPFGAAAARRRASKALQAEREARESEE